MIALSQDMILSISFLEFNLVSYSGYIARKSIPNVGIFWETKRRQIGTSALDTAMTNQDRGLALHSV